MDENADYYFERVSSIMQSLMVNYSTVLLKGEIFEMLVS